jgi:hypothetical protein
MIGRHTAATLPALLSSDKLDRLNARFEHGGRKHRGCWKVGSVVLVTSASWPVGS